MHVKVYVLVASLLIAAAVAGVVIAGGRDERASPAESAGAARGAPPHGLAGAAAERARAEAIAAARAQAVAHGRAAARARARRVLAAPLVPVTRPVAAPTATWQPVATIRGQPAVWIAQSGGVTSLRFDQRLTTLHLHAGSAYPGGSGWPYGDQVTTSEAHRLVAGFNGGFKFNVPGNGFVEGGRVGLPLSAGLGSVVTYRDGATDIGPWHAGVPEPARPVESVRQNLRLLVDGGVVASSTVACPRSCWGDPLGERVLTARSGLGITPGGDLVWAAGEQLTPAQLAQGLVRASVIRAVELDINPFWVAGYLYVHHPGGPAATPVVPGQHGIYGQLRVPYNRDFFTVVAR